MLLQCVKTHVTTLTVTMDKASLWCLLLTCDTSTQLLNDILAGKRVEVKVGEGAFWRTFGGDQSPEDLETALQLVYRLFTSTVAPDPVKLATCIRRVIQLHKVIYISSLSMMFKGDNKLWL